MSAGLAGRPRTSRSTAATCGASPTGCSGRWPRRTTRCRRPGSGCDRADTDEVENLRGWLTTVVSRDVPQHAPLPLAAARGHRRRAPARPARRTGRRRPTPSTRRCSPTPWAWRCSSCSRRCRRPSGWRSCSTTCSPCRSTRSPRWSTARRRPPASSPAGPAGGCRAATAEPDADLARQREVVDAFFAAARDGDFDALVAVLDPDVVLRSDAGALRPRFGGRARRDTVAGAGAHVLASSPRHVRPAVVNGAAGVVVAIDGRPSRSWASPSPRGASSPSTSSPTRTGWRASTSAPSSDQPGSSAVR